MPEDTRQRSAKEHLLGAMVEGSSGYITGMEADGQRQLLESHQLPREGDWDKLAELGFVRGEDVDDLFCKATLPEGWTKQGTSHSLWTEILDDRGIKRVAVGYKAAFYDRWARISVLRPGYEAFSSMLYGDQPVELPDYWGKLTDAEKADTRTQITKELAELHRDSYKVDHYRARLNRMKELVA